MILTGLALGQASSLAKEPRLQKPISLKMKIVPISEALSLITKQTEVFLDRSPAIKDLKVTVLVQDQPAGLVLDKIASALGCEWKADAKTYRLVMDPEEKVIRDRYLRAEDEQAQKELASELEIITKAANVDRQAAQNELIERADPTFTTKTAADPSRTSLLNHAINRQDVSLGNLLLSLSPDKVSAFWKGDLVAAPTSLIASTSKIRGPLSPAQRKGRLSSEVNPNACPYFVRYDPLLYRLSVLQGFGVRYISKHEEQLIFMPSPTDKLALLPFGKEVLAWDQSVPTEGELAKLVVNKSALRPLYGNKAYSVADFLEKAFDQTHVAIVADAFRVPAAEKDFNQGIGGLPTWLEGLKKENDLFTRFEDGFVMVRHGGFWRLRKFETPEELLRPLEAKGSKSGPTLQDYSQFVSKLTPEQAKPFCIKNGTIAGFDTTPIQMGFPALKFFSTLSRKEIAQATQDGLPYGQLSTTQKLAFADAFIEGCFYGATPATLFSQLFQFYVSGDGARLGFLIRPDEVQINAVRVIGNDLVFGQSATEATSYQLPVSD